MRTGPTNPHHRALITTLKRESHTHNAPLWAAVAQNLEKPRRQARVVNISRINRHTKEQETIIVPGKVLGSGQLDHPLTIAAWDFSTHARDIITKARGTCLTIPELLKKDPTGKTIRLLG